MEKLVEWPRIVQGNKAGCKLRGQNTREIPGFMLRLRVARIPIVNSRGTKRVVDVGSLGGFQRECLLIISLVWKIALDCEL